MNDLFQGFGSKQLSTKFNYNPSPRLVTTDYKDTHKRTFLPDSEVRRYRLLRSLMQQDGENWLQLETNFIATEKTKHW